MLRLGLRLRLGLGLGLGSDISIMVSIRVSEWMIMVILRWEHSDREHFNLVSVSFDAMFSYFLLNYADVSLPSHLGFTIS